LVRFSAEQTLKLKPFAILFLIDTFILVDFL